MHSKRDIFNSSNISTNRSNIRNGPRVPVHSAYNSVSCLRSVFRIRICLIQIRIQPKISIQIQIPDPDPDLVKFLEIIIFSFIGRKSLFLLVFVNL
jgi:hypothetical protein